MAGSAVGRWSWPRRRASCRTDFGAGCRRRSPPARRCCEGAYYRADGLALLWVEPWAEEKSLSLGTLDPLFIEICRRIRLVRNAHGLIEAWGRPSEVPRVFVPKESGGNIGDAWTPVSEDGKALTVGAGGFDYRLMTRLLGKEFNASEAMRLPPGKHSRVWLQASVLVRGQGKTEGLHERWLPIPANVQRRLLEREPEIGRIASAMVEEAGKAQSALRWGLQSYLQGGPDKPNAKDERPREWAERLDRTVEGMFFGHLFGRIEGSGSREAWLDDLCQAADRLFDEALERLSPPDQRREKARVFAEQRFRGAMKTLRPQKEDAA